MKTTNVPRNPQKRRLWIKHQLESLGSSYADIAREEGVSRQAVRKAVAAPYPKMEKAIAKKLGLKPEQVWPERYLSLKKKLS